MIEATLGHSHFRAILEVSGQLRPLWVISKPYLGPTWGHLDPGPEPSHLGVGALGDDITHLCRFNTLMEAFVWGPVQQELGQKPLHTGGGRLSGESRKAEVGARLNTWSTTKHVTAARHVHMATTTDQIMTGDRCMAMATTV